jgi:hypothetical protein
MAHLTETQRIGRDFNSDWVRELNKIKLKQKEFLHRLVYCQQVGGWQFLNFKYLVTQFLTCFCSL